MVDAGPSQGARGAGIGLFVVKEVVAITEARSASRAVPARVASFEVHLPLRPAE